MYHETTLPRKLWKKMRFLYMCRPMSQLFHYPIFSLLLAPSSCTLKTDCTRHKANMPSLAALLPFFLAASGTLAAPQSNSAAVAAGNSAALQASLAAVSAAAQFTQNSAASAAAASESALFSGAAVSYAAEPSATGPDQCGPTAPDSRVPDSCDSYVAESTGSAQPYEVSCLNDGSGATLNITSCMLLIPIMCSEEWQDPSEWLWASDSGCSLGSYLPKRQNADGSSTGAAPWPSQDKCEILVYSSMIEECTDDSDSNKYNVMAVNLPTLPSNTGTGTQVDAGYASYVISPYQLRNETDVPGGTAPNDIPVSSIIAQEYAAQASAFSVDSAVLATMTGSAAAAAKSDLAEFEAEATGGSKRRGL